MLTRRICYDNDHDDKLQERIKAQAVSEPATPWTPPVKDPTLDVWGKPVKLGKQRRSRSMWA